MTPLIAKIDEELARIRKSRRWLSLEVGRAPGYIQDIAKKGTRPKDLPRIAAILGRPIDYFVGEEDGGRGSLQLTVPMPTNPRIVARAEQLADMVMTRLIQRRGIASLENHEARGRIVAAAMDGLIEAERQQQPITDEFILILVAIVQSLLG